MFERLMRFLGRKPEEMKMQVKMSVMDESGLPDGWYIVTAGGEPHAGPYKRESDAKGQLTRLQSSYTPASRRPRA